MTDRIGDDVSDRDATVRDSELRSSQDGFVQDIGIAPEGETSSCHAGRDEMRRAAAAAGSSDVMDQRAPKADSRARARRAASRTRRAPIATKG